MLALSLLPLLTCRVPNESELQTRAAEVGQTAVAQGVEIAKTEAAQLEQTAMAELATQVATRLATPTSSTPFTVDSDLTQVVSVTGSQLDAAIQAIRSDSGLIGLGQTFVEVGNNLGINAYYIAAHAAWESTWGNSALAEDKNNLFGYGAYDSCPYECAWSFQTKADCVQTVMPIIKADYLTPAGQYYNGATLRGMNVRYASDPNWMNGIASIMNSLFSKTPR